jgi:hypothetical protein
MLESLRSCGVCIAPAAMMTSLTAVMFLLGVDAAEAN